MQQNYKISISYDGTNYHGWQRQPDKKTIQGQLETALKKIFSGNISVIGSGRTDAGVHARGQVAHFKTIPRIRDKELFQALNGILPKDIRINSLEKTDPEFHARKSASSKIYQYRIYNSPDTDPFFIRYTLQWSSPLDLRLMKEAALLFVREADFSSFSSNRLLHPVRKVFSTELTKKDFEIVFTIEATGFLRYMVRSIVGTLLEVGRGKIPTERIEEMFLEKKRSNTSPTAPAKGLCLMQVKY